MSDRVTRWLQQLDLEEFAGTFAEQQIEFSDLTELTDSDLKELGLPLGPRKRLLKAIGAIKDRNDSSSGEYDKPQSAAAERRQLTIMFCDLAGSTELSTRLDPEELREIITACHDSWKVCIERYAGFVARYMGDGVLAYFGFPHAHEDDPERAIRAGLDIISDISNVEAGVVGRTELELRVRVGIATGPVVVGDLIGEGASAESAVIGETPNLAARLQGIADTNSVVISSATQSLAGPRFNLKNLGAQQLKGIGGEMLCWEVTSQRSVESRFEVDRAANLTELLGRDEELSILERRWQRANDSEGQLVLISGEPGIGKSRLVQTLNEQITSQQCARFHYQCSPMHSDSALYPVVSQIESAARILTTDNAAEKLAKLVSLMEPGTGAEGPALTALGTLLSIPADEKFSDIEPDPEKRKAKTFEAIIGQIEHQAASAPVLCIFEDVHWVDPSTMELLEQLVERIQSLPVLVIVTYRPEFNSPWTGLAHATLIALNRMGSRDIVEMVNRVAGGKALPAEILEQIVAKTDGIPLFVEELTRNVMESGLVQEHEDCYVLTGPLPPLAIPATLQDSLTARLDRLSSVKQIAQLGAVIGRSFDYPLLAAVADLEEGELSDALVRLEQSGLVLRRGMPPSANYTFKHALIRDSAYQSLLTGPRQSYHQCIAESLEQKFPEVAETDPALLALHYTEAGLTDIAIDYWSRAGERALESSAYHEAISNLHHALGSLPQLADYSDRYTKEIRIQLLLGASQLQVHGQGSDEALASYTRAYELCNDYGTREQRFRAQWGMHFVNMIKGDLIQSRDIGLGLVPLAEEIGDPDLLLEAHHVQWSTMFALGQVDACNAHLDYVIPRYRRKQHHRLTFDFGGHDPGVCAYDMGALAKWLQGAPGEASNLMSRSLELAEDLAHPFTLFESHMCAGYLRIWEKDSEALAGFASRIREFVEDDKLPQVCADFVTAQYGAVLVEEGRLGQGMEMLAVTVPGLGEAMGPWVFPIDTVYADGLAQSGRPTEGVDQINAVLESVEQGGVHWWDAEFYRVRGEILLRLGAAESDVEAEFRNALECARSQKNRFLELRAAMSLDRVLNGRGDGQESLSAAIDSFAGGQGMAELDAARARLEKLAAT